jgi:hypothetical protein
MGGAGYTETRPVRQDERRASNAIAVQLRVESWSFWLSTLNIQLSTTG